MEKQDSVQSPLQILTFDNSGQNFLKSRYQIFLILSNFAWFSYFLQNTLSLIAEFEVLSRIMTITIG